jgi:hypothetical protein
MRCVTDRLLLVFGDMPCVQQLVEPLRLIDERLQVMHNAMEATSAFSLVYFIVVVSVGTFIILNLTVAIITSNFGEGCAQTIELDDDDEALKAAEGGAAAESQPSSSASVAPLESEDNPLNELGPKSKSSFTRADLKTKADLVTEADEKLELQVDQMRTVADLKRAVSAESAVRAAELKLEEPVAVRPATVMSTGTASVMYAPRHARPSGELMVERPATGKRLLTPLHSSLGEQSEPLAGLSSVGSPLPNTIEDPYEPELELGDALEGVEAVEECDTVTELAYELVRAPTSLGLEEEEEVANDPALDEADETDLKEMLKETAAGDFSITQQGAGSGAGNGVNGSELSSEDDEISGFYDTPAVWKPAVAAVRTVAMLSNAAVPSPQLSTIMAAPAEPEQAVESAAWSEAFSNLDNSESQLPLAIKVNSIKATMLKAQFFSRLKGNWHISKGKSNEQLMDLSVTEGLKSQLEKEKAEEDEEDSRRDWTGCVVPAPPKLTGASLFIMDPDNSLRVFLSKVMHAEAVIGHVLTVRCGSWSSIRSLTIPY